ncbi:MAG: rhomboid family intramembrane serine protease [Polyangiaceae bacterium]
MSRRRVPAPRRTGGGIAAGSMAPGPGTEPFLGRWAATTFPGAKLVFAINLAIFAVQIAYALDRWGISAVIFGGAPGEAVLYGAFSLRLVLVEPWRLITANWVHFGIIHFGFNMLAVAQLSRIMEPAIGTYRYLFAYVVTGVVGFVASAGWSTYQVLQGSEQAGLIVTAGASASLFGVLGVILGFLWRRGDPRWKQFAGQTIFYALIFGFVIRANNAAHIGGLLAGIPFGILFAPGAPKPSRPWQRVAATVCIVASLGSLVAARMSPYYQDTLDKLEEAALEER